MTSSMMNSGTMLYLTSDGYRRACPNVRPNIISVYLRDGVTMAEQAMGGISAVSEYGTIGATVVLSAVVAMILGLIASSNVKRQRRKLGIMKALLMLSGCGRVSAENKTADTAVSAVSAENGSEYVYCLASVSKIYSTAAVMQLVDKGKVALDTPITEYIPDFKMADSRYNDGFNLLEMIVENVTGMSYTDYVKKNISDKIGVTDTGTPIDMYRNDMLVPSFSASGLLLETSSIATRWNDNEYSDGNGLGWDYAEMLRYKQSGVSEDVLNSIKALDRKKFFLVGDKYSSSNYEDISIGQFHTINEIILGATAKYTENAP